MLSLTGKATAFRIILWRCWATVEHGIAQTQNASSAIRVASLNGKTHWNYVRYLRSFGNRFPQGVFPPATEAVWKRETRCAIGGARNSIEAHLAAVDPCSLSNLAFRLLARIDLPAPAGFFT